MKQESRMFFFRKRALAIICCMLVFCMSWSKVYADSTEIYPSISPSPKPVEYTLPYPGLLPDNPLYFFRAIRDTMQGFMVSNPLKKADYYLLQADKGISAALILSQKKETVELAAGTANDALNYYEKALEAVEAAKKQGLDTHGIVNQLIVANHKHQEVLSQIQESAREDDQEWFAKADEKAQQLGKKAKSLLPAK